jgi:hypothetical protein
MLNGFLWSKKDNGRCVTGVPMVPNTSFNENEPVVFKPQEALLPETKMDPDSYRKYDRFETGRRCLPIGFQSLESTKASPQNSV